MRENIRQRERVELCLVLLPTDRSELTPLTGVVLPLCPNFCALYVFRHTPKWGAYAQATPSTHLWKAKRAQGDWIWEGEMKAGEATGRSYVQDLPSRSGKWEPGRGGTLSYCWLRIIIPMTGKIFSSSRNGYSYIFNPYIWFSYAHLISTQP